MTTAAALTLQDVGVRWGRTIALDDITVDVPAGSVVGVLGRASAGRTTLVRLLAGRLPRYRGTASVGGVEASQVGDHPGLTYLSTGRWPGATGASVTKVQASRVAIDFMVRVAVDFIVVMEARDEWGIGRKGTGRRRQELAGITGRWPGSPRTR